MGTAIIKQPEDLASSAHISTLALSVLAQVDARLKDSQPFGAEQKGCEGYYNKLYV